MKLKRLTSYTNFKTNVMVWSNNFLSHNKVKLMTFFAEFPEGCTSFKGPHSLKCRRKLWLDVGCTIEGRKFPQKDLNADLDSSTLKWVTFTSLTKQNLPLFTLKHLPVMIKLLVQNKINALKLLRFWLHSLMQAFKNVLKFLKTKSFALKQWFLNLKFVKIYRGVHAPFFWFWVLD